MANPCTAPQTSIQPAIPAPTTVTYLRTAMRGNDHGGRTMIACQ